MQSIDKAAIEKRLQYIIKSLENESHSTNFGYAMEDGVRLILETHTRKVCELFEFATGCDCRSSGCIVSYFEEQMENLSLSTYYKSTNNLQLLLPSVRFTFRTPQALDLAVNRMDSFVGIVGVKSSGKVVPFSSLLMTLQTQTSSTSP